MPQMAITWSRFIPGLTVPVSTGIQGSPTSATGARVGSADDGGGGGGAWVVSGTDSGAAAAGAVVPAGGAGFLPRNGILSHAETPATRADNASTEGHLIARLLGKRQRFAPTNGTPRRRRPMPAPDRRRARGGA